MDDLAETGLSTLDNDVGNLKLAAERRQEDDKLDGVNVVSDGNEFGLLGLDEGSDVVETVLGDYGLGSGLNVSLLAVGELLSSSI